MPPTAAPHGTPEAPAIARIIADHLGMEGPLLPILHAVRAEFGHVPATAHAAIAAALNITRAELHGVISFYHDFKDKPAGRHVVRICRPRPVRPSAARPCRKPFWTGLASTHTAPHPTAA